MNKQVTKRNAIPAHLVALQITGDLAGITYTTRGNSARRAYVKTYPFKATTANTIRHRANFTLAVNAYTALSNERKQLLRDMEKHYQWCMFGRNVFISVTMIGKTEWLPVWAENMGRTW